MKPYSNSVPSRKISQIIIYGVFAFIFCWIATEVRERIDAMNRLEHIGEVAIGYYQNTGGQENTVNMAAYMRKHLAPADYQIWLQEAE